MNDKELTPQENVAEIITNYLIQCDKKDELPTIEGLAIYAKVSDDFIVDQMKQSDFVRATGNRLKLTQKNQLIQRALKRKYDPNFARFLLSVNHGMIDATESRLTGAGGDKLEVVIVEEKQESKNG